MIPSDGFTMGSGLGPGGSSLLASWKEGKPWNSSSLDVRIFITLRCIIARWMDDLYILKPSWLPPGVAVFFKTLTDLNFYGVKLLLERDFSVQPFGFIAILSDKGLQLSQNLKYRASFAATSYIQKWPSLQSALSFQSVSQKKSIMFGLGIRTLDMAASEAKPLIQALERYQLELLSLGFSSQNINLVSAKIEKLASRELSLPRFSPLETWNTSHDIRRISLDTDAYLCSLSQLVADKEVPFRFFSEPSWRE